MLLQHPAQPCGVDNGRLGASQGQRLQMPLNQWFATHLQQRFGASVGQGPHALAPACSQNDGLGRNAVWDREAHSWIIGGV